MLYLINSKYYIKRTSCFVEVEFDVTENDVILKPTTNKVKITNEVSYDVMSYDDFKKEKLSAKKHVEEVVEKEEVVKPQPKTNKSMFSKKGSYSNKKY